MNTYDHDENTIDLDAHTETVETSDDVEFEELDWVGDEKKDKQKLKDLREALKKSQKESHEHLTLLQRSRADYVNLNKELDQVQTITKQKTTERIMGDILPVLDSFDMAMGNSVAWESVDKNWRIGVEFIYSQLKTVLENYGITSIDSINVPFDPNLHEPMETSPADDTNTDTVYKIIQKGYRMGDRIIRPAKVGVYVR
jgi:molecular chaperone GrpE